MEIASEPTAATKVSNGASSAALQKKIAQRARELYELRGCVDGHALEDWVQAEAEVPGKLANQENEHVNRSSRTESREPGVPMTPAKRTTATITVRVGNAVYRGEYDTSNCTGYKPGTLRKGQPIEIRFDQEKMYVELPDGKELERS